MDASPPRPPLRVREEGDHAGDRGEARLHGRLRHEPQATGVHDDLWAGVVAVSDGRRRIGIVAVDLIGVFRADVLKTRELLQQRVPGAVLVVTATHNHEGPDTIRL